MLTISPKLLGELDSTEGNLSRKLIPEDAKQMDIAPIPMDQATFEHMHAANRMAHDQLKEGIEGFSKALRELEKLLATRLTALGENTRPQLAAS